MTTESSSTDEQIEKHYKRFLNKLWVTKGCRYEANKRLLSKDQVALFSVSLLSIYAIGASLAAIIFADKLTDMHLKYINLTTVITSIFILVLSHIISAKNYSLRAENMLRCAKEISEIHSELSFMLTSGSLSLEDFEIYQEKYHSILRDYKENHEGVDYSHFIVTKGKKNKGGYLEDTYSFFKAKVRWFSDIWAPYIVIVIFPPLVFGGLFTYISGHT